MFQATEAALTREATEVASTLRVTVTDVALLQEKIGKTYQSKAVIGLY